ncbi:hypothetical protein ACKAV7_005897 [Fusarium commune]
MGNTNSSPFNLGDLGQLSQLQTNGESSYGTFDAPDLPTFLTDNPTPNGYPWSTMNSQTNYYQDQPNTGVIRRYDFTVSRGTIAPDGYELSTILVNGQFPAPLIEANWGDTIQVTVHNDMDDEGVSLHWHGILQKGMPWEDGVPGVTQCPIPPKKSFTYQFLADLYGTSWYHSHYSAQVAAGLFGPLVIYGPREKKDYDIDIGPVMLSDWYHKEYFDLVEEIMKPGGNGVVLSDSNLINGKMNFNCSSVAPGDKTPCKSNAGISKFRFKRGKVHRLRLINPSAEAIQRFSIDGHTMKVIANDFVPVQPYDTKVVTLGVGQRTDVLVRADGKLDSYWMRSNISAICSLGRAPAALAAIYYDNANQKKAPKSQAWDIPDPGTCANDDLSITKPVMKLPLPPADKTIELDISSFKNASNVTLWTLGGVAARTNYNSPTLLLSKLGNHTFEPEWNVINTGKAKSTSNALTRLQHRRDVVQIRGNGHLVIQFDAGENPGTFASPDSLSLMIITPFCGHGYIVLTRICS